MKTIALVCSLGLGMVGLACPPLPGASTFNVRYDFESVTTQSGTTDPTPVPTVPGVVFGSFRAVGYTGNPNAAAKFSWRANELGGIDGDDNFADFTGHLNAGKYFEVTLAPQGTATLSLDAISFAVRRSATGIRSYAVRSSLDDFAANLPGVIFTGSTNLAVAPDNSFQWRFDDSTALGDQHGSRVLLGDSFCDLLAPVTFRFYAWNAETSSGTFSIDNVYFGGRIEFVPEPAPGAGWALTAIGLGIERCRQAKRRRARRALEPTFARASRFPARPNPASEPARSDGKEPDGSRASAPRFSTQDNSRRTG